jgi:hypothetical protein
LRSGSRKRLLAPQLNAGEAYWIAHVLLVIAVIFIIISFVTRRGGAACGLNPVIRMPQKKNPDPTIKRTDPPTASFAGRLPLQRINRSKNPFCFIKSATT